MILTIDVGNTNIVFGLVHNKEIQSQSRIETKRNGEVDDFVAEIRRALKSSGVEDKDIEGAIMASVVPEVNQAISLAVKKLLGLDCMQMKPGMKTGMPIKIAAPETLGADILAGCVGALSLAKSPLAVVDLGTATTMVVVDKDGCYIGGAILPGVRLSFSALARNTSLLPNIPIEAPEKCICSNTIDSLKSGAVFGTAAQIDGMLQRMEQELNQPLNVIATGGLGQCIIPYCQHPITYEPNLILLGLAVLYEKNRKA